MKIGKKDMGYDFIHLKLRAKSILTKSRALPYTLRKRLNKFKRCIVTKRPMQVDFILSRIFYQ